MSDTSPRETVLKGIGGSPGICIGKAYLIDKEGVDVIKHYAIHEDNLESEKNRFKTSVKNAKADLHQIIEDLPEDFREHASILETHMVLLKDKMLYGSTIDTIEREGINAEWALRKVVTGLRAKFRNMSDPYFRERGEDIVHVSDRIMRKLLGAELANIKAINKRVILVAGDLSPAETSQIQLERIMGFVTNSGGMTSHTGIIARTLQIPAVLGLDCATSIVHNDDLIIVDGFAGELIINPTEETLVEYTQRHQNYEVRQAELVRGSHLSAETTDGISVQVMGNIELSEEVVSVRDNGGDGIGLYRTEFQYLSRSAGFPTEYDLFDKYKDVVEVMHPKPVTIRTLDINGDKALSGRPDTGELNPALGLRGIRYCLKKTDVFKTQLRAILRAAAYGNVRVLFPMISSCNEVTNAVRMLDEAAESLDREGVKFSRNVQIGIMIEVPSAVIMADMMAKGIDFFSIGTNDLIQYTLAIDRGNKNVAHLYHPLHPAIIRMIKHVSDVAKDKGVGVFMCGEMAGDPAHVPILLGLGIDELSMNPYSIPPIKRIIRSLEMSDAKAFVEYVLKQPTASGVTDLLQDTYSDILPDNIHYTR